MKKQILDGISEGINVSRPLAYMTRRLFPWLCTLFSPTLCPFAPLSFLPGPFMWMRGEWITGEAEKKYVFMWKHLSFYGVTKWSIMRTGSTQSCRLRRAGARKRLNFTAVGVPPVCAGYHYSPSWDGHKSLLRGCLLNSCQSGVSRASHCCGSPRSNWTIAPRVLKRCGKPFWQLVLIPLNRTHA